MTLRQQYDRLRTWVLQRSVLAPPHRALAFRIVLLAVWAYFMGYMQGRTIRSALCQIHVEQHGTATH